MSDIENLVIDNYPKIDLLKMTVMTEFSIDSDSEISISINNSDILCNEDIIKIDDNIIYFNNITFKKDDVLTVIYNKIDN
jgi:hypothetical protein